MSPQDQRDERGRDEPAAEFDRRRRDADRRDDEADHGEALADERERSDDVRERVLDRWEQELSERAASLELFDDVTVVRHEAERAARSDAHSRRRAAAEQRRAAAIEREADQVAGQPTPTPSPTASVDSIRELGALGVLVVEGASPAAIVANVVAQAAGLVPSVSAASAALSLEGRLRAATATSDEATELDRAQISAGRGLVLDAFESGEIVATSDLAGDVRWGLGPADGPLRRSGLSAAIVVDRQTIGVLTVYGDRGHVFGRDAVTIAALLAARASLAIQWSLDRLSTTSHNDALERALDSRDQIAQAKGILMEQRAVTADEAYLLLRAASQSANRKVLDIAAHVIAHRTLPSAAPEDRR